MVVIYLDVPRATWSQNPTIPRLIVNTLHSADLVPSPVFKMVYSTQIQSKFSHAVGEPVPEFNSE